MLSRRRTLAALALLGALPACGGGPREARRTEPYRLYLAEGAAPDWAFEGLAEAAAEAARSYLRVVVRDPSPASGAERASDVLNAASGFLAAPDRVFSAAHIVKDPRNRVEVVAPDGTARAARVLRIAPDHDLALMSVEPWAGATPVAFAGPGTLAEGDRVFALGAPGNRPVALAPGRVVDPDYRIKVRNDGYGFDRAVKMAIAIEAGYSGGPVFDRNGRLVGLSAGFAYAEDGSAAPRLGYAIPADELAAFLDGRL